MVEMTIDARQMAKLQQTVGRLRNGIPRVLAPAINRALDKGRTTVRREIRKQYVIKQKDIPVKVRGANRSRLSGEVRLAQGMLELSKFKVAPRSVQRRKNKRPIRAQVKASGGGLLRHAFMTPIGGPFQRKGIERLPIEKLLTIGAPIMASQPAVGPAVNKEMGDTLAKRIDHEIQRVMVSAGGH